MGYRPIREYAIVGNDDRFALIDREGSIDWLCFPHGAAPSVFARLLDDEVGGHFAVRPTDSHDVVRDYFDGTNVLKTTFETGSGRATLTDFMPVSLDDRPDRDQRAVYRRIRCTEGTLDVEVEFKPRLDYARADTTVERIDGDDERIDGDDEQDDRWFVAESDDDRLSLQVHGGIDLRADHDRAVGVHRLSEGDTCWFVLQYDHATPVPPSECRAALEETVEYWRTWSGELLDAADPFVEKESWREAVRRSGLVLKLLINEGTGAIYAAATTSLPEKFGGSRNWDYRHNWIRDAKFTVQALYNLGSEAEAHKYFEWFREISQEEPEDILPVYGVHHEVDLTEHELTHLAGYRHSQPVRIGNAAAEQTQHDIYGAIVQGIYETLRHDERLTDEDWESIRSIVDHVCEIWDSPDHGIWEYRDERRHYTHSKLLCWVALDRGIDLAEHLDREAPLDRWRDERDALEEAILEHGYSESIDSFVQHFDTEEALDATCLLVPVYGFLPPDDDRVEATIDAVRERLQTDEGFVYRTDGSDAVDEEHGAFLLCTFWLVDALVLAGRTEEAKALFENVLEHTDPLGLLSERIDPETGELLGNFPQAFSHIGLVNSAIYLASARDESRDLIHDPQASDVDLQPLFRKGSGSTDPSS